MKDFLFKASKPLAIAAIAGLIIGADLFLLMEKTDDPATYFKAVWGGIAAAILGLVACFMGTVVRVIFAIAALLLIGSTLYILAFH
ncbi:MAG: hypothetical protein AAF942_02780 [Pseudomonadota bacterium]